ARWKSRTGFPVAVVCDWPSKWLNNSVLIEQRHRYVQKNREENKFSSRVEVRVVTPKKFGAVNSASGLMPLFLRCFFLCCFFLCHRLIPPFQSATRGALSRVGNDFTYVRSVIITFFL